VKTIRTIAGAVVAVAIASITATATAGETRPQPRPKPIVDTPCDRHDLGPKLPPIKFPTLGLPKPGQLPRPMPTRPK
jgi:hypothetical protein